MVGRRVVGGEALVAGAAALWALIGVCTRELADLGMAAEDVGAWRALIGGACFVVHLAVRGPGLRRPAPGSDRSRPAGDVSLPDRLRAAWLPLVGFAVIGVVVFYVSLPLAVDTGGISLAYVLLYTAPIWVILAAAVFLGERLAPPLIVAAGVSVLGVVALVASAGGTVNVTAVSVTWGLVSGLSYSSYYILGRRLFDRLGATLVYALVLPAGGIVLAAAVGIAMPTAAMLGWLALLGFGCTYLPYLLFGIGITRTGSARAVVVAMIEPVLAAAIGVAFYGEQLGLLGMAGALAVLVAAATVGIRREAGPAEVVHP